MKHYHAPVAASCRGCRAATVSVDGVRVRLYDAHGTLLASWDGADRAEADEIARLTAIAHGAQLRHGAWE